MKPSHTIHSALILLLLLVSGCGGGSKNVAPSLPPPPTSAAPWFGTAGNVLVSDRNFDQDGQIDFIWVGFNSQAELQTFLSHPGSMVGGTVVSPASNGMNFYLDPNTTTSAELAVPELITSLDGLKADPTIINLFDKTHRWLIRATMEQVK